MALIKCPECGNMISDKALACPHCGAPRMEQQQSQATDFPQRSEPPMEQPQSMSYQNPYYEEEDNSNRNKWLYGIIGLLVLALLGIGYWAWNSGLFGNHNKDTVSESKKNETPTPIDSQPATIEGTQNFIGSIGSANVEMSIFIDGSDVSGYYHYNSQDRGHNMILQGTMSKGGVINLAEYEPDGTNSGRLDAVFNGTTLEGSLINTVNGKQQKVNLSKANSLSKLSPVTKATLSEIVSNLTQFKEEENEKSHFPTWLLGAWKMELYDDYGNSMGTMYSVISHSLCKTYADGKLVLEQKYNIDNRTLKFESGGNYLLNFDEEKLISADGREWIKISDNTSYIPSSSTNSYYSQNSTNVSSVREPYSFSTAYDVLGYVSDKVFTNGRRDLRIRPDGIYINNFHASKGVPYVVRYFSNQALIRVKGVDGSDWDFNIDPVRHRVVDDGGNVYELE